MSYQNYVKSYDSEAYTQIGNEKIKDPRGIRKEPHVMGSKWYVKLH